WTTVTSPDTTVPDGQCSQYRYSEADRVGNRSTPVVSPIAMVDTTKPGAPGVALTAGPSSSITGTTVFYRLGYSGSFTADMSASDAQSGIKSVNKPDLGGTANGW